MFRDLKIRTKLVLTFVSLIVVPLLVISCIGFHIAKKSLKNAYLEELKTIADLKVDKIETFYYERKADITTTQACYIIKTNLPIITQLANDRTHPDYLAAKKILDGELKILQQTSGYSDVMLVSPEGKIVYVTNEAHVALDIDQPLPDPDGKAFEEGKKGIYFSDIYLRFRNKTEGSDFGMLVTAPVHDVNESLIGVTALEVDMEPVYKFIQDTTGLGETGETLIGLNEGDHALFLNYLRHDPKAAFKRKAYFGQTYPCPLIKAVQGENASGVSIDYRGEEIIAAWRYIPSLDWGLVAKIDTSEAFVPINKLRNISILIVIAFIIVISTVSIYVSIRITHPLQKLVEGTKMLAKGDLSFRIEAQGKDELGQLTSSFNNMVSKIRESKKRLDDYALHLEKKEESYRILVQTIPDIIYKIDLEGYFTFVSNSIRSLGYEPEEIIGKHISVILHPDDVKEFSRFFVLKSGDKMIKNNLAISKFFDERRTGDRMTRNLELRLISKIHEDEKRNTESKEGLITVLCELTATGVYVINGSIKDKKLLGTLGIIRDISEKIRLQAETIRAGQMAVIGELTAYMAHEINNPICGIINYAQLIVDESDKDSRVYKFGKLIMEEGDRIAGLAKNLLTFSRSKPDKKIPVQIYELILNSLRLTEGQLKKDNIIIKENIPKTLPAIIANPRHLQQVFLNLIQNARYALNEKYAGKSKNKIFEISCNKVSHENFEYIQVIFRDRGIGIREDILSKVTNPFFTTKPPTHGTGIGLSISQNIIDDHGGKMTVESTQGEYTSVVIDLPLT